MSKKKAQRTPSPPRRRAKPGPSARVREAKATWHGHPAREASAKTTHGHPARGASAKTTHGHPARGASARGASAKKTRVREAKAAWHGHPARGASSKSARGREAKARTSSRRRRAAVSRATKETSIDLSLDLDGRGKTSVQTGVGFFDHMLDHVGRHGLFDLTITARGDLNVDGHHTVEDVGICLGEAIARAVGEKRGIRRYGFFIAPMEESLAQVVVDLSGRAAVVYKVRYRGSKIGGFDVELIEEFLRALALNARMNLHVTVPYGTNNHHIAEAIFKALGKALRMAVEIDPREKSVPSTKGVL